MTLLTPIIAGTILGALFGGSAANLIAYNYGLSAVEVGVYVLPLATAICTALVAHSEQRDRQRK